MVAKSGLSICADSFIWQTCLGRIWQTSLTHCLASRMPPAKWKPPSYFLRVRLCQYTTVLCYVSFFQRMKNSAWPVVKRTFGDAVLVVAEVDCNKWQLEDSDTEHPSLLEPLQFGLVCLSSVYRNSYSRIMALTVSCDCPSEIKSSGLMFLPTKSTPVNMDHSNSMIFNHETPHDSTSRHKGMSKTQPTLPCFIQSLIK
jgi:hypothetical protein